MGTKRWMRPSSPAAWALLLVLGLPALAQAQGGQPLFPNLTTYKRQRPPCCSEPPIYGIYRRQYYGHYPTCWRQFPPGWGCPSPYTANSAEAMQEIAKEVERLRKQAEEGGGGLVGEPELGAPREPFPPAGLGGDRDFDQGIPEVPREVGSPFDLNPTPPDLDNRLPVPGGGEVPSPPGALEPPGNIPLPPPPSSTNRDPGGIETELPPLDFGGLSSPEPNVSESTLASADLPPLGIENGSVPLDGETGVSGMRPPAVPMGPPSRNGAIRVPQRRTLIGSLFDGLRDRRRR